MSKGFTIKATAPTPTKKNEEDFDLQAAKEMIAQVLENMNKGHSWALLRVAEEQSV